jgi:nicotinamide-nucleotide amidase
VGLEFHPELWDAIRERFARLGRIATENNRKQAELPAGAAALPNPLGTAPGFSLRIGPATVFAVPGVPREMEAMLSDQVIPALRRLAGGAAAVIRTRTLHAAGLGESVIDEKIGRWESCDNPTVGLTAQAGLTDIRIVARAADPAAADALIAGAEADIRSVLGAAVFGADGETLAGEILRLLPPGGALATVESGTRGRLAGLLEAEGSGAFRGGWVAARPGADFARTLREWTAARGASHGIGLLLQPAERGFHSEIHLTAAGEQSKVERLHFIALPLAQEWAAATALLELRTALRKADGGENAGPRVL